MGDFFTPTPGYPPPPDAPDAPAPDFTTAGTQLATGVAKSGMLSGIWQGFVEAFLRAIAAVLGWLMGAAADIAIFVMNRFTAADEKAGSSYGPLVAATYKNLFGIDAGAAQLAGINNAANRADLGNQIGAYILQTILNPPEGATGSGVVPSDAGPKKFLGTMTHMAVEGWLHSWLFDALTVHELEKFGELKDVLTRTLGIGRLSRQMFAAPIKVFVHDPYQALLNQKYRPTHLPEASVIHQYFRGALSRQDLSTRLGNLGYSEQNIEFLINEHGRYLPNADVDYLVARGIWNQDQAVKYISEQGWDTAGATRVLEILHDKRIDVYRRQILEAGEKAFIEGNIPIDQFQQIANTSGLNDEEITWRIKVAGTRKELTIKRISEAEIIKGIEDGILNLNDFRRWALDHNMPLSEEQIKELEIQFDLNKQSAAAAAKAAAAKAKAQAAQLKAAAATAKAAAAKAQAADRGVTVGQAESLVKDGLWTFDHLTAFLTAKGYGGHAIDAIVQLLHAQMAAAQANKSAAAGVRAAAAAKGLNLAQVEHAVVAGILGIPDLRNYLASHGFDQADATVIVELAQNAVADAQMKAAAKAAAHQAAGAKQIDLAQLEHAARLGLTPVATYHDALVKAGYDDASVTLLVGILRDQVTKDQATAAKQTAATATAATRGVSLAQLESEVVAGVRPIADYTKALAALGYDVPDQRDLTQLLQLKVDAAKSAASRRAAAGDKLAERGISLAQAERAVKLAVVPIATYQQLLSDAGYTPEAAKILSNSLLAEVAQTRKAQTADNAAAGALAKRGISLPQLERAVIEGVSPIDEYAATLKAEGYSAADVATLSQLLELKVEQAQHARERQADAIGRATERGISLAQEEQAVLAGDHTLEDYDAMLTTLGYDAIDRATLDQLLNAKIQAAAAKAGDTTAPGAGV